MSEKQQLLQKRLIQLTLYNVNEISNPKQKLRCSVKINQPIKNGAYTTTITFGRSFSYPELLELMFRQDVS